MAHVANCHTCRDPPAPPCAKRAVCCAVATTIAHKLLKGARSMWPAEYTALHTIKQTPGKGPRQGPPGCAKTVTKRVSQVKIGS